MGKRARVVSVLWKLLILLAIIAVLFVAWLLLIQVWGCGLMGKYLYNGVLLPDINTVWTDKTAYPNAYIYQSTSDYGQYYCLVVVDKTGYMGMYGSNHEFGPSYTLGAYELHESEEKTLTYCEWIIAADEDAAGKLSGLWPGITSTEWLQVQKHYSNIHAGTGNGIIWSNHKILNEDGSTYVEASNPVPKFDLKSWLTGFALGLAGKPLPIAPVQKEPVAFLYNGVRLPKLPVVEGYNHAYLCKIWTDRYKVAHLFLTAEPLGITDPKGYITSANVRIDCMHFAFDLETGTAWEEGSKTHFMYQQTHEPFWANTDMEKYLHDAGDLGVDDDVYTPTGEIGLYAIDPIPVYE